MDLLRPIKDQIHKLWGRVDVMPVVRWATVTQASPLRIRLDGDADPMVLTPQSTVAALAVGERVVCVEQNRRIIIISRVEQPERTGTLTLATGSGSIRWKYDRGAVTIYVDVSGSFTSADTALSSSAMPAELRPSEGIAPDVSYLDGTTSAGAGVVYLAASSGMIRHGRGGTGTITRIRGKITYVVGF